MDQSDHHKRQAHPKGFFREVWLRAILVTVKPRFKEVLVMSLFINLLALAVPLFTLQVYDRVVSHEATSTLWALLVGVGAALAFDFIIRKARGQLLQRVALHIDAVLGRKLYEKFSSLPLRVLESRPASFWQALWQDAALIRTVFSGPTAVLVADLFYLCIYLLVIFIIATAVAWVLIPVVAAFLMLAYASTRSANAATSKEHDTSLNRDALTAELIMGRVTAKALAIDKAMQPQWEDRHAVSIELAMKRGMETDGYITMGQSLSLISTIALVSVGALTIISRDMTIGALIATNMMTARIIGPLNQLVSSWKSFAACRQAIGRLDILFGIEGERAFSGMTRGKPRGHMTVDNVVFAYDQEGRPTLDGITCEIHPGEMVGVVGRNGSGKTTFIKLLQGLYTPSEGRVLLDGGDLNQFSRVELAEWIGYVPQECFLFDGTVKENIAKACPDAEDEDILRASKLAGADPFIVDLPDGYSTRIGEGGSRLSGGQRQRLAIARALLRQPPILLFDEITSNLDIPAELALRQHLVELAKSHTIVIATHSMALLSACTRIIVLDRGKVAMMGPGQEILARISGTAPRPQPNIMQAQKSNGQAIDPAQNHPLAKPMPKDGASGTKGAA